MSNSDYDSNDDLDDEVDTEAELLEEAFRRKFDNFEKMDRTQKIFL